MTSAEALEKAEALRLMMKTPDAWTAKVFDPDSANRMPFICSDTGLDFDGKTYTLEVRYSQDEGYYHALLGTDGGGRHFDWIPGYPDTLKLAKDFPNPNIAVEYEFLRYETAASKLRMFANQLEANARGHNGLKMSEG